MLLFLYLKCCHQHIITIERAMTIIAGIPAPTQIIITGPKAIFGKLFKTTRNGSETLEMNGDHHNIIAIIEPEIVPSKNPIRVSVHVIFKCSSKSFEDKFINVFTILDG